MQELSLKYGCNPNQQPARVYVDQGELPLEVKNGRPGYINLLDALNSWQLVRELKQACRLAAAASFKHVSPAGAALGQPLSPALQGACLVQDIQGLNDSPLACAYARARGADRMSSFGDWIALSDPCDETTARLIKREVSDGVIAPGYSPEALAILSSKRQGNYCVLQMDEGYQPPAIERKQVFGLTFEQGRNSAVIDESLLDNIVTVNKALPQAAKRDLLLALITLKYTQSNSVALALEGQAVGVGAGQQSRIHCTRLACDKAGLWLLRQSQQVLELPFKPELGRPERSNVIDIYLTANSLEELGEWRDWFSVRPDWFSPEQRRAYVAACRGLSLASDAFFPFGDNIERAGRCGVSYVAQPGGSVRDDQVIATANRYNMVMACTGLRLFHH